ncbi:hypothetical protein [Nocardioides sp.]|uniref:tetratricopeptide repeat protein n=1 Tax=Nocardioides sp. TaxID=35761 RepID=UPI0027194E92|nr:hypothetical protein [Nocardioides sp.]MDO9456255.1 hypothetical protein [Nocardioides sp.]
MTTTETTETTTETARRGKTIGSVLGTGGTVAPAERLSRSSLWQRQRDFYDQDAEGLWGSGAVPHHITGNPAIAHTYARLALEFLRSVPSSYDDRPHVVEIGGGSGRFAYLFVRHLRALAPTRPFTYVLTDFAPERVAAWAACPAYRPMVEDGFLDFAVLDADDLRATELVVSGRPLGPGSLGGPVVGIANYVFDSLRADAYLVRSGELLEVRAEVPTDLRVDGIGWESAPCGALPDDLGPILEHYRDTLDDTAVLVPTGALACLDLLDALSNAPSCALVADKGHATALELCSQPEPAVVLHGSGFSLMVNFDLVAEHTRRLGGVAVLPRDPAHSLVVAAFVRGAVDDPAGLAAALQDHLVDTGPDNAFLVRPLLGAARSVETALACLRLAHFDPVLLVELLPLLLETLPDLPDQRRSEVERVLLRVWDNWFPIGEPTDLALCVGLALSAMDRFARAVDFLEISVKEHPDSAPAAFAMGVARRGLRDLHAAHQWAERALELEPGFAQARALRAVVADEMVAP